MTSPSTNWRTPPKLFKLMEALLPQGYDFMVDAAADGSNHLCELWYGPDSPIATDAFGVDKWLSPAWCNPPYTNLDEWTLKFTEQAAMGNTVIALLPARTGTKWWYEGVVRPKANVVFLVGRVHFIDPDGSRNQPNHDSAIVIYRPGMSGSVVWGKDWDQK